MGNTISSKEETIKIPDPFYPIHKNVKTRKCVDMLIYINIYT
jgi:hypothetical protein